MKKFLINTVLYSLLIVISLIIGEVIVRQTDNPYKTKTHWLAENGSTVKSLFLGNSHSFYGLRAELWPDKAFNLANVSQTLEYDKALIKYYIPQLHNLKRIILQVSYTSFFDDLLENSNEWWRCINYQLYTPIKKHSSLSKYGFEISNIPVYTSKLLYKLGIGSPDLKCDSLGNGLGYLLSLRNANWTDTGVAIAREHRRVSVKGRVKYNITIILEIADICKQYNIDLILYSQPEWIDYLKNIDIEQLQEMYNIIHHLTDSCPNISYYDFIYDNRFTNEDFFDADHLTYDHGAIKLTKFLSDTIFNFN